MRKFDTIINETYTTITPKPLLEADGDALFTNYLKALGTPIMAARGIGLAHGVQAMSPKQKLRNYYVLINGEKGLKTLEKYNIDVSKIKPASSNVFDPKTIAIDDIVMTNTTHSPWIVLGKSPTQVKVQQYDSLKGDPKKKNVKAGSSPQIMLNTDIIGYANPDATDEHDPSQALKTKPNKEAGDSSEEIFNEDGTLDPVNEPKLGKRLFIMFQKAIVNQEKNIPPFVTIDQLVTRRIYKDTNRPTTIASSDSSVYSKAHDEIMKYVNKENLSKEILYYTPEKYNEAIKGGVGQRIVTTLNKLGGQALQGIGKALTTDTNAKG